MVFWAYKVAVEVMVMVVGVFSLLVCDSVVLYGDDSGGDCIIEDRVMVMVGYLCKREKTAKGKTCD